MPPLKAFRDKPILKNSYDNLEILFIEFQSIEFP